VSYDLVMIAVIALPLLFKALRDDRGEPGGHRFVRRAATRAALPSRPIW
jgi:hypothetical protein